VFFFYLLFDSGCKMSYGGLTVFAFVVYSTRLGTAGYCTFQEYVSLCFSLSRVRIFH